MRRLKLLWRSLVASLTTPTGKQREAYARLAHTLTAAAVIGAFTLAWSGTALYDVWRVVGLALLGLILFISGSLLIRNGDAND